MSKMVVEDIYRIIGRGFVLVGRADCKPKLGPVSITNPDGKSWETTLIGVEQFARYYDPHEPRPVGMLCAGVKEGDVKEGAVIRFSRNLDSRQDSGL